MLPRPHRLVAAAWLALLAGALGCRGPERAPDPWQPGSVIDPATLAQGSAIERQLETRWRASSDQDVIELELQNTSGAEIDFAYTIEWLDRQGRVLPAEPVWRSLRLGPGGSVPLRLALPGPPAESWRLRALGRS